VGIGHCFDSEDDMSTVTPIGATRWTDYTMDRDQEALDEARLRADDMDAEARHSVTYQMWLEEMSNLSPDQKRKVLDALNTGDAFSRWTIEVATTAAFERAVKEKVKEMSA
jgi:hypothetical protein